MRAPELVTERPSDADMDVAAHLLVGALDNVLDALIVLVRTPDRVPTPSGALHMACLRDPAWARAEARCREVTDRIRRQVPAHLGEDFEELDNTVRTALDDSAAVGFAVGLSLARGAGKGEA